MLADQPLIPLFFYVSKHLVDRAYSWLAGQWPECGLQQKSRKSRHAGRQMTDFAAYSTGEWQFGRPTL